MEKRELSSTLRNLKFMQRAALKEEKTKKVVVVDQEDVQPSATLSSSPAISRKCIVILEGDPHPVGSIKGRMSFQNFNPTIDKLNEEPTEAAVPSSVNQSGRTTLDHHQGDNNTNNEDDDMEEKVKPNGELKRKQIEVGGEVSELEHPKKSPKIDQQKNHSSSSSKKRDKLDWKVLRPPSKRTN
ncbi:uncharacterized protein LOC124915581 [Impatiens glandulifera]|uniref:uncharacterized protein LOC124915581 n=1 Tax=Impatiens glandulifera TaxID=253017 RepID=UPI001FB109B3|nr:uncharacterized protein LOC124915581 [Impatiens glandulifera]